MARSPLGVPGAADPDRTAWVDVARALCIVLVVMMHATLGFEKAAGATGFLHPLVEFFTPIRIPTFFVVSGLFMAHVLKRSLSVFVRTRIVHLGYFYLLWLAIQLVARSGAGLVDAPHRILGQFTLALVEPYDPLWFLHLLIIFSLLAYALRQVSPRVVLTAAAMLYLLRVETGSVLIDEFTSRAVFFAAGWALAPLFFASARLAVERPALSAALVLAIGAVNLAAIRLVDAEGIALVGLILGLAGAAAMAMISAWLAAMPALGEGLASLGRRSLVIYVAFTFPMAALRAILTKTDVLGDSWLGIGFGSLLITAAAIAAPLLLESFVRGTPLRFLFHKPRFDLGAAPALAELRPKRT